MSATAKERRASGHSTIAAESQYRTLGMDEANKRVAHPAQPWETKCKQATVWLPCRARWVGPTASRSTTNIDVKTVGALFKSVGPTEDGSGRRLPKPLSKV